MKISTRSRFVTRCLLGLAISLTTAAGSEVNRALRLNGSSACLRVADSPALHVFTNAITLEIWFKAASFSTEPFAVNSLIRKNPTADAENFFLRFRWVEGRPTVEFSAGHAVGTVRSPVAVSTGQWYHLAGTYDGKSATVFVNGVAVQRAPLAGAMAIDPSDLIIGCGDPNYSGGEFFHGDVDEIRLWNTARSANDIRATMNTRLTGREAGLVACWDFDRGSASAQNGQGLHGKLQGGAQIVACPPPTARPGPPALPAQGGSTAPPPVAIFEALCQALRDNYPMLELVGWREDWVREFRRRIEAAPDRKTAFELMNELVCRLNDYHTSLRWPGQPRLESTSLRVEPVLTGEAKGPRGIWDVHPPLEIPSLDGLAIAVVEAPPAAEAKVGDEILEVDGVPVREALARAWRQAVGSSAAGKLRGAAERMLLGAADRPLHLRVRRPGGTAPAGLFSCAVPRVRARADDPIASREVDGVPVIRIRSWDDDPRANLIGRFDAELERWRTRPGLILDVRDNGGGSDGLAEQVVGRFLRTEIISSISFVRQAPGDKYERMVATTAPRGPWRYEGRVAVLTNEGCMSACEHFVSGMIEAGALTCGTPTSGACGWIRRVELPGGARLYVSRTYPLHTGGVPSPLLGIAPHVWAPPTLGDVRAGRDAALATALRWVRGSEPRPTRIQPVAPLAR